MVSDVVASESSVAADVSVSLDEPHDAMNSVTASAGASERMESVMKILRERGYQTDPDGSPCEFAVSTSIGYSATSVAVLRGCSG